MIKWLRALASAGQHDARFELATSDIKSALYPAELIEKIPAARNRYAVYPIALALASCTGKPPVTVSVPVAVPCIAPDKVPQLPPPLGAMPGDANAALSLAIDRLLDWRLYGIAADGVMRGCAGVR